MQRAARRWRRSTGASPARASPACSWRPRSRAPASTTSRQDLVPHLERLPERSSSVLSRVHLPAIAPAGLADLGVGDRAVALSRGPAGAGQRGWAVQRASRPSRRPRPVARPSRSAQPAAGARAGSLGAWHVDPAQYGAEGTGGHPSPEALALLDNERVTLDATGIADLKAGKIDPRIVSVLTAISQDHRITVSAMTSRPRQAHDRRLGLQPLLRPRRRHRDRRRPAGRPRQRRRARSSRSRCRSLDREHPAERDRLALGAPGRGVLHRRRPPEPPPHRLRRPDRIELEGAGGARRVRPEAPRRASRPCCRRPATRRRAATTEPTATTAGDGDDGTTAATRARRARGPRRRHGRRGRRGERRRRRRRRGNDSVSDDASDEEEDDERQRATTATSDDERRQRQRRSRRQQRQRQRRRQRATARRRQRDDATADSGGRRRSGQSRPRRRRARRELSGRRRVAARDRRLDGERGAEARAAVRASRDGRPRGVRACATSTMATRTRSGSSRCGSASGTRATTPAIRTSAGAAAEVVPRPGRRPSSSSASPPASRSTTPAATASGSPTSSAPRPSTAAATSCASSEARGLLRQGRTGRGSGGDDERRPSSSPWSDGGGSATRAARADGRRRDGQEVSRHAVPLGWIHPADRLRLLGLVQWAYAKAGIQIPRTSEQQILASNGKPVDRKHLMPGDLVFFRDSSGDVHHVGISLGGDKFIHAPHTGDVVKISSLKESYYAEQFAGGRRFDHGAGQRATGGGCRRGRGA